MLPEACVHLSAGQFDRFPAKWTFSFIQLSSAMAAFCYPHAALPVAEESPHTVAKGCQVATVGPCSLLVQLNPTWHLCFPARLRPSRQLPPPPTSTFFRSRPSGLRNCSIDLYFSIVISGTGPAHQLLSMLVVFWCFPTASSPSTSRLI